MGETYMRIAVDFDDTLFDKAKGTLIKGAAATLQFYRAQGHHITVFTNRPDYDYSTVSALLVAGGIPFDRLICGKPSYDIFIDDRARRFTTWEEDYLNNLPRGGGV